MVGSRWGHLAWLARVFCSWLPGRAAVAAAGHLLLPAAVLLLVVERTLAKHGVLLVGLVVLVLGAAGYLSCAAAGICQH
jgi:hypothetical protein